MASAAAQDEYDATVNQTERVSQHPEDAMRASSPDSLDEKDVKLDDNEGVDSSDEDEVIQSDNRKSKYYLPAYKQYANTGPKGVIADAQAFENAKSRNSSEIYSRTKDLKLPRLQSNGNVKSETSDSEAASDTEEHDFMRGWRDMRLQELREKANYSPGKPRAKRLDAVDGLGYLEAVEGAPTDTVVVVYIFDPKSQISSYFENLLTMLAQKHPATRFIKLHYKEAEMEVAGVPAVLAYQNGNKFADMIPLADEMPVTGNMMSNLEDAFKSLDILG